MGISSKPTKIVNEIVLFAELFFNGMHGTHSNYV